MAFCAKCGTKMEDNGKFCPGCGAATEENAASAPVQQPQAAATQAEIRLHPEEDAQQNKVMGILAYLGILVLVPIFAAPNSKFACYHANQGLVVCLAAVAYWIVTAILNSIVTVISWRLGLTLSGIFGLIGLAFVVLEVIGLINAAKGERKPLPIIGGIRLLK